MNTNEKIQCKHRVYVDISNLVLVGKHLAAVEKRLAPSIYVANTYNVFDHLRPRAA